MKPGGRTLRELAAQLKVSTATVSLALRNHPSISPATRRRIQEEAARLGYRPNALVSTLMAQVRHRRVRAKSEVLAYLTAMENADAWKQLPSHADSFSGASARAEELGYRLEPFWLGDRGIQSQRTARILRARGVRGSILPPVGSHLHEFKLDWENHPVVAMHYSFQQVDLHRVSHDQFQGMLTCYEQLYKRGYERIGLVVNRNEDERCRHHWTAGFLTGQEIFGGRKLKIHFLDDAADPIKFIAWFKVARPDALIGANFSGMQAELLKRGVRMPEDLGYAALHIGHNQEGQVSGIQQDWEGIAAAAIEILAGLLYRNEYGLPAKPKNTVMKRTWMEGNTAPPRNPATKK